MSTQAFRRRGGFTTWVAFLFGVPLTVGMWFMIKEERWEIPLIQPYLEHDISWAELAMFFGGVGILLAKVLVWFNERLAFWRHVVPAWDGQAVPVSDAAVLRDELENQPGYVQRTYLGRRVAGILDFVASRGAANELDDHIRTLADNDGMGQENSFSLLRFITWAIPILGFLGTVIGITQAIAHVSPEQLEHDLGQVTGGLATAFDSTALALALTMVLMFGHFVVERLEQGILERLDSYVEAHLAHRFERTGVESGEFVDALRQNVAVLLKATEQLVERQTLLWHKSFEKADRLWGEAAQHSQENLHTALEKAIERTLDSHEKRLVELENKLVARCQTLFEGLTALATTLRDTGREQQGSLKEVVDKITQHAQVMTKFQEGEDQLVRLQHALHQNLTALTGAGQFEQAVQSLTAAIHLMTARQGNTAGNVRPMPRAA